MVIFQAGFDRPFWNTYNIIVIFPTLLFSFLPFHTCINLKPEDGTSGPPIISCVPLWRVTTSSGSVQFSLSPDQRKQSTAGKSLISLYRYNNGIGDLFREALKGLIANISAEYKTYCSVSSSWWKQLTKHSLLVEAAQTGPLLRTICSQKRPTR